MSVVRRFPSLYTRVVYLALHSDICQNVSYVARSVDCKHSNINDEVKTKVIKYVFDIIQEIVIVFALRYLKTTIVCDFNNQEVRRLECVSAMVIQFDN